MIKINTKQVTSISIDKVVWFNFKKYCQKNNYNLSKKIEEYILKDLGYEVSSDGGGSDE